MDMCIIPEVSNEIIPKSHPYKCGVQDVENTGNRRYHCSLRTVLFNSQNEDHLDGI